MTTKTARRKLNEAHAAGPSRVEIRDGREFQVFVLEDATREEMMPNVSIFDSLAARADLARAGLLDGAVEQRDEDGESTPTAYHRRQPDPQKIDAVQSPFTHVVAFNLKTIGEDGGLTSHRGVLAPGEYVDPDVLRKAVEEELGYTYEQIRSVYRQGPLSPEQRKLRGVIDARMLALRRSGANMTELGRALGFRVKVSGNVDVLDAAVARAKANSEWFQNLAAQAEADADLIGHAQDARDAIEAG
jgi:hypothetical protein